ncbi:MAG: bifunctional 5,10-methylenetetrahydrofolate dehydrogenase/5,10-methenyltetrahydrofolate cyclohydrolase [Planctomycetota bacterium]
MTAVLIDGKAMAEATRERLKSRAEALRAAGSPARLDAVLVEAGDNAARVYAANQAKACRALGIDYELHLLEGTPGEGEIIGCIDGLNADPGVHAMMIHMPLPDAADAYRVKESIDPLKDVEGVTPANIGNIVYGRRAWAPCTALATLRLIEHAGELAGESLTGKRCVVVGAGPIVGRPIAVLLMEREATVVSANKFTQGLPDLCRSADVLVAAAGVPGLVRREWIKPGAMVIDVGVNRVAGEGGKMRTVGDVRFDEAREVAGYLSPVPGGVGPMTVATLLEHVVEAGEAAAVSSAGTTA